MSGKLLPSDAVLETWTQLSDAARWANLDDGMVRAINRQLGDPGNESMQILAIIPEAIMLKAIDEAQRGLRPFNVIEKAQSVLMINAIRQKFGVGLLSVTSGSAATVTQETGNNSSPSASSTSKIKIKLCQVIDQGSDMEIEQLDPRTLQKARRAYVQSEGDSPLEKEEVTDAQISALAAKVNHGLAPFVDMGVWGPYGERLARQMKFTSQILKDGQWKSVELPGTSSISAWEEAWRIFRTAAIMLGLASPSVLDRYASEFKSRVQEYPDCWHLAAQADIRCRSEFWMQEKRRQEDFHAAHANMSSFNTMQPWNGVIKAAANSTEFWHKEFEKPALLYKMNGPRAMRSAPEPPRSGGFHPGSNPTSDKKQHDPKRRDGRFFKSMGGVNICYDLSRNENGCNNEGQCPKGMSHVCEWCRQPHRTINCPQVPGWTQDKETGKGKGKRSSKGKGGAKRPRHMWQMAGPSAESGEQAIAKEATDRLAVLREKLKMARAKQAQSFPVSPKRSRPNEADQLTDTVFLEIFAGAAGLTSAVQRLGGRAIIACDIHSDADNVKFLDLTNANCFKDLKSLIKKRKVRWLHLAPPCKTFSRARRRDRWARVWKLRPASKPEGLDPKPKIVREANLLASRSAQLANLQYKTGGWFSIENPFLIHLVISTFGASCKTTWRRMFAWWSVHVWWRISETYWMVD